MVEIGIGIISGIVSGIGMGGGTILIFLLGVIIGLEHHVAQASNLLFFVPTSFSAIMVNIKNKNIDFKLAKIVIIFGVIGAIIGAKLAVLTNVKDLKKYFGIFLLVIAIHEIYTLRKH